VRACGESSAATLKGDLDGDGSTDIVWQHATSDVDVWAMRDVTRRETRHIAAAASGNWRVERMGDFDQNGSDDLVVRNYQSGENEIWLMTGAQRTSIVPLPIEADLNWRIGGVGDLNNDGRQDIVFRYYGSGPQQGSIVVWSMDGTSRHGVATLETLSDVAWQIAAVADMDADGMQDLVMHNTSTGQNQVWLMNGLTRRATTALNPTAPDARLAAVGDYDRDGFNDIVWRRSDGTNVIWLMTRTTFREEGLPGLPSNADTAWTIVGPR
jgi:VCBS repeat protein